MQLVSSWFATQLSESPSGRRQREHRNTSGLCPSAGSAASSRRVLSEQATEASPLMELHMFAHSCSSWWRLESSESRLPNREESSLSPLWPNGQLVEEHPSGDKEPSISYKSPAPRSITGGKKKPPLGVRGAGRGGGGPKGRGLREAGSEGSLIARMLEVEAGTSCGVQAPGSWKRPNACFVCGLLLL